MDATDADQLVKSVAAGFEVLQAEYQKLHGQHQALERRLATARDQYRELAKLYSNSAAPSSPPLSLSSNHEEQGVVERQTVADILDQQAGGTSHESASKIREATQALDFLRHRAGTETNPIDGVKIWSGRSADDSRPHNKRMPSVQESPLEQDFTIEGVPSKLGCPFASMANKKLSSHAASVLSRYGHGSQSGGGGNSVTATSRINGRESLARRNSQRAGFADTIEAEILQSQQHDRESPHSARVESAPVMGKLQEAEVGVCPIRFLDQQSPEQVATYFEKHKHELPRSHEVCVKRYQSNEQQIRQLDAKYGNLVNMIQGLGAKHQNLLPDEPKENDEDAIDAAETAASAEKVRKWANSVSAHAADGQDAAIDDEEERLPHFERPLRDIRVGESPSRPWGISVPPKYLDRKISAISSLPAAGPAITSGLEAPPVKEANEAESAPVRKCPFSFGEAAAQPKAAGTQAPTKAPSVQPPANESVKAVPMQTMPTAVDEPPRKTERVMFTGPVFFGYSAEDAAKMLQQMSL